MFLRARQPHVPVLRIDATDSVDFTGLKEQFDKARMINVLEHASDEQLALKNVSSALAASGRAIILVPSHPGLLCQWILFLTVGKDIRLQR